MQTEQDTARLLRSFLEVARHLTQEFDVGRILSVIVERTMELTGARYGAAATLGAGGIEQFLHRGLTPEEVAALPHYPEGKGLLGAVLEQRRPLRYDDLASSPESVGFPNKHVAMSAFLGVPMLHADDLVGALYLTKPPNQPPFTSEDEVAVSAMASMAAVGITNARLFNAEAERAERAATLGEIASAVRHSLDVTDVLAATVEQVGAAAAADRCFIRLVTEPGSEDLGPIEHEWTAEGVERIAGLRYIQYPVSMLVARTLETQWSANVMDDPRIDDPSLPPVSVLIEKGTAAVLATPLEWGGELMGIVTLHSIQPREWTPADIALLEAAAREVSVALHHARLYEQAVRTADQLKQLDELRTDFLSMVSHELRSPMTVVTGIAHILHWRRERLTVGELDELLETLERESRRLTRLVSEFLDMEAIERGKIALQPEELDLVELAGEAMVDAGLGTRVQIVAGDGDAVVTADRDRIKQVLLNLMGNAAKFSALDQPITVTVRPSMDGVSVTVADKGPGIAPEDIGRLFERFSRLSSTVNRAPGSGIGLYVSRTMVELHGGRIWVDSTPGTGTAFSFWLPRGDE